MNSKTISKERISQIINDIAEDMGSYTKVELVQVVNQQQDEICRLINAHCIARTDILAALTECVFKIVEIDRKHHDELAELV